MIVDMSLRINKNPPYAASGQTGGSELEYIMKKYLLAVMALLIAMNVASCGDAEDESKEASLPEAVSTVSTENDKEKIAGLEAELAEKAAKIAELESKISSNDAMLSDKLDEIEGLYSQINALTDRIQELENKLKNATSFGSGTVAYSSGKYYTNHQLVLTHYRRGSEEQLELKALLTGESCEILTTEGRGVSYYELSPKATKVVYDDFEYEASTTVYLYDVESKATKTLDLSALPENRTAAGLQWLDDRYFMFVVQLDHGTIVRGGDVYVYDTQTDKYQPLIVNSSSPFQTFAIDSYEKLFVIKSFLYDDTMNFTTEKYHTMTADEIYALIEGNKTVDLSLIKPLND